jgi:hypothetical protein
MWALSSTDTFIAYVCCDIITAFRFASKGISCTSFMLKVQICWMIKPCRRISSDGKEDNLLRHEAFNNVHEPNPTRPKSFSSTVRPHIQTIPTVGHNYYPPIFLIERPSIVARRKQKKEQFRSQTERKTNSMVVFSSSIPHPAAVFPSPLRRRRSPRSHGAAAASPLSLLSWDSRGGPWSGTVGGWPRLEIDHERQKPRPIPGKTSPLPLLFVRSLVVSSRRGGLLEFRSWLGTGVCWGVKGPCLLEVKINGGNIRRSNSTFLLNFLICSCFILCISGGYYLIFHAWSDPLSRPPTTGSGMCFSSLSIVAYYNHYLKWDFFYDRKIKSTLTSHWQFDT